MAIESGQPVTGPEDRPPPLGVGISQGVPMSRITPRLSVRDIMVGVAVGAFCLALVRINGALAVIAACVALLAWLRVTHLMQVRRLTAERITAWQWTRTGLRSLVVAAAIILSADVTFFLVYTEAESHRRERAAHPPPPKLNWGGVIIGAPLGVLAGYAVRCWLWEARASRTDARRVSSDLSTNTMRPSQPRRAPDPAPRRNSVELSWMDLTDPGLNRGSDAERSRDASLPE